MCGAERRTPSTVPVQFKRLNQITVRGPDVATPSGENCELILVSCVTCPRS